MMKYLPFSLAVIPLLMVLFLDFNKDLKSETLVPIDDRVSIGKPSEDEIDLNGPLTIAGIVKSTETMESIFKKYGLDKTELAMILSSSEKHYNLSKIKVGNIYSFEIDRQDKEIQQMRYMIDGGSYLSINDSPDGFVSEIIDIDPEKRIGSFSVDVRGNLFSSMPGRHREYRRLALELSEIYAWDIDFSSDIRDGDAVKIIAEELWVGDAFKGYGEILAVEFANNGTVYRAYRFEHDGYTDYYDEKGRAMKKTLLRSPLKFKYISSGYTHRRFHPILGRYRAHLAIDYAAPKGTPVSAAGSGTIRFAGYKGQNGKMVKIRHNGGFETYYGHLSRIPRRIRKGAKVSQGDIIGYVGSTGLSTGPHLDYRIKLNGRYVNPLKVRLPRGKRVPESLMAEFEKVVSSFEPRLTMLERPFVALEEEAVPAG